VLRCCLLAARRIGYRDSGSPFGKGAVASGLVVLTLIMGVGIFAFGMFSQLIVSGAPLQFPR
jgi:hypothetical protein